MPIRTKPMQSIVQALYDRGLSLAWLGQQLTPRVRRQTVSAWRQVPEHYIGQVAALMDVTTADVRPDLAALFASNCTGPKHHKRRAA